MSKLDYHICSGTSAQGKQKIYFCCHPDDFDEYFKIICDDIFSKEENCAIYYESDPLGSYDRDELLFLLGDMQLFVVPVTWRLLTEPNRAMELEIPFALGQIRDKAGSFRHIAVLPVIFGADALRSKFTAAKLFQGIQYLVRYSDDKTALTYDEKLGRYLNDVIICEEEAEKIRSEFRAAIFLSYRKIDRAYARKLMEDIHKNELCRDVSIWYDEYLVPGESWRKGIDTALSHSDLFVLNVTDKLQEAGNFVFKEEYPDARDKLQKPILSVITNDTAKSFDLETIKRMFPGIEKHLVESGDKAALHEGLIWGLTNKEEGAGKEELLEPDNRSDHLYYIGLAYKNSVGLEANPEKAVELLEDAGKRGELRAFLKLGHIYEHGDGVKRDEKKAIEEYDEFIVRQKPYFGTSRQGDLDLVNAYDSKGLLLMKQDDLDAALKCYKELNALIDGMTSCYGSFKQINLPISYERIAMICSAKGNLKEALQYFDKATDARMHPPVTVNIATEEEQEKDRETAAAYNKKEAKTGAAVNLYSVGELLEYNLDIAGAKDSYLKSNELFASLTREYPEDDEIAMNLAKTCVALSRLCAKDGNTFESAEYDTRSLELLERLAQNPRNMEALKMSAVLNIQTGDKLRRTFGAESALDHYLTALEKIEKLVEKDPSKANQYLLATVYEKLGLTAKKTGMIETSRGLWFASTLFAEEAGILEEITKDSQNSEYLRGLSVAYENLGMIARENEHFENAIEFYGKDLAICEKLADGNKENLMAVRDLGVCCDQMSVLYQLLGDKLKAEKNHDEGNYQKALDYAVKSLILTFKLIPYATDPVAVDDLATSLFRVGTLCMNVRKECFYYAERIWSRRYEATKNPEYSRNLSVMKQVADQKKIYVFERNPLTLRNLMRRYPGGDEINTEPMMGSEDAEIRYMAAHKALDRATTVALLIVIVLAILQITGIVDVRGFLQSALGPLGTTLLSVFFLILFFSSIRRKN